MATKCRVSVVLTQKLVGAITTSATKQRRKTADTLSNKKNNINHNYIKPLYNMEEKLLKIKGYEKYYVSNLGAIYSDKHKKRKKLKQRKNSRGYFYVNLCKNGKYKSFTVHRIVAKAFCDNYSEDLDVNHIDCNKANNSICNLEMVTRSQNIRHAEDNNLTNHLKGEKHCCAKLSNQNVREIRSKFIPRVYTMKMLAREYNVHVATIKNIIYGVYWKSVF